MRYLLLLCCAASLAWGLDAPAIGPGHCAPPRALPATSTPPPEARRSYDLLYAGLALIPFDKPVAHSLAPVRRGERASDLTEACNALGDPRVLLAAAGAIRLVGGKGTASTSGQVLRAVLTSQVSTASLKLVAGRARPDRVDAGQFSGPTLADGHGSFPSGHAAAAFAAATVLAKRQPKRKAVYYGLATLAALARVRKGEHYLSDVCAGAWVGIQCGRSAAEGMRR